MTVAPKKWTRHHVRRLYHISRLVTFLMIAVIIFTGVFAGWFSVSADDLSGGSSVSAFIEGVQDVTPTSTPTSSSSFTLNVLPTTVPEVNPPQTSLRVPLNLTAFINAGQSYKKLIPQPGQNKPIELNIVTVKKPSVFGNVDVPGAFIYFELIGGNTVSNSGAYADSHGRWQLTIPGELTKGFYFVRIIAQDPVSPSRTEEKDMYWYYAPSKSQPTPTSVPTFPSTAFHSWLMTVINKEDKKILPGSVLRFQTFIHNGDNLAQPLKVSYSLFDNQGNKVFETENLVDVKDTITIQKAWKILPSMAPGIYVVDVRTQQNKFTLGSQDNFQLIDISAPAAAARTTFHFKWIYLLLIILLIILIIVWYDYRKVLAITKIIKENKNL